MNDEEFGGIGLAVGVVTGARSFTADNLGRLTGVVFKQVWRPGENTAKCMKPDYPASGGYTHNVTIGASFLTQAIAQATAALNGPATPERTPSDDHGMSTCKCGFYGYYDGSNDYHKPGYVSGVIQGYGETLIGTRGFRASRAKIVALHLPEAVVGRLVPLIIRNYPGIPLFESFESMVAEFPPDVGGMEVTPDNDPNFWDHTT